MLKIQSRVEQTCFVLCEIFLYLLWTWTLELFQTKTYYWMLFTVNSFWEKVIMFKTKCESWLQILFFTLIGHKIKCILGGLLFLHEGTGQKIYNRKRCAFSFSFSWYSIERKDNTKRKRKVLRYEANKGKREKQQNKLRNSEQCLVKIKVNILIKQPS